MTKKQFLGILFVGAFVAFLLFNFSGNALAAKGVIKNIGTGSGGSIVVSDLGITDVGTLPSSRWYFLKEWGRGFERLVTLNAIEKVKLELHIANEHAAEALTIKETEPENIDALEIAIEKYTKDHERFFAQLLKLKETSNNPEMKKLLETWDDQSLKHAILLNQLAERWYSDPYAEDESIGKHRISKDSHLQALVNRLQGAIQYVASTAAQKEENVEQKAAERIARAEAVIKELELESAEFAINEPGVPNTNRAINTKGTGAVAKTTNEPGVPNAQSGPVRLDPTPARISTNMMIERERQTLNMGFDDRMKAGLRTARGMLANAKERFSYARLSFANGAFGEAFGEAHAAEAHARNGLRVIILLNNELGSTMVREGADADAPEVEDMNSVMPTGRPETDVIEEKIVPEVKTRVFPETNNRVFPETNNRTACDDRIAPGCTRGETLECHNGKWTCIGPASGQ